jgi:hypothetical protein
LDKNKTIPAPIKRISRDVLLEKTLSAAMGYSKSFPAPIRHGLTTKQGFPIPHSKVEDDNFTAS